MKAIVLILFATSVFAQDQAAIAAAEAACGPKNVKFDVRPDETQHPVPQPETGKALVYVIEDLGQLPDYVGSGALIKVGMDGAWVGASEGASYLFFAANPGERHLCVNWQSRLEIRSRAFAMVNFTAEAGKIYYFRARVFSARDDYTFDLDPVNSDQGKFLVASSAFIVSHPNK
jgi:hypothetical protein